MQIQIRCHTFHRDRNLKCCKWCSRAAIGTTAFKTQQQSAKLCVCVCKLKQWKQHKVIMKIQHSVFEDNSLVVWNTYGHILCLMAVTEKSYWSVSFWSPGFLVCSLKTYCGIVLCSFHICCLFENCYCSREEKRLPAELKRSRGSVQAAQHKHTRAFIAENCDRRCWRQNSGKLFGKSALITPSKWIKKAGGGKETPWQSGSQVSISARTSLPELFPPQGAWENHSLIYMVHGEMLTCL